MAGVSSASANDYVPVKDKEVLFPAGVTLQAVDVKLLNNDRWEEVELFKVVLEHLTTKEAVEFVKQAGPNVAGTITPQHLLVPAPKALLIFSRPLCPRVDIN